MSQDPSTTGVGESQTEMGDQVAETTHGLRQKIGWLLGPAFLIAALFLPEPEGLSRPGLLTAGVALLMATWWITESIPIPATALLPLVLFPLLGITPIDKATEPFAHPLIFLFLGGFLLALAMQKWNLHKRIAIALLSVMGTGEKRIIAGFLLASAFISMWVSNTATALMMLPIALSIVALIPVQDQTRMRPFITALLLAVAYGATTGGMATLIGTPPNALLAAFVQKEYGFQILFGQWMLIGVPVALVALAACYVVLTRFSFRLGSGGISGMADLLAKERAGLGRWSRGEIVVGIVFLLTASAWVSSSYLTSIKNIDTIIALIGGLSPFLIPINWRKGQFAMDWAATRKLPWDVLLLFGGGLCLASAISSQGLAAYLGSLCEQLAIVPLWLLLAIVCFGILMLTELTSNTATAATFFPVIGVVAATIGRDPLLFLVPTAMAANCSYMMPVGTPPNAIVFGSGHLRLPDMARAGMWLNIALVPIILLLVWAFGPGALGLRTGIVTPTSTTAPP